MPLTRIRMAVDITARIVSFCPIAATSSTAAIAAVTATGSGGGGHICANILLGCLMHIILTYGTIGSSVQYAIQFPRLAIAVVQIGATWCTGTPTTWTAMATTMAATPT